MSLVMSGSGDDGSTLCFFLTSLNMTSLVFLSVEGQIVSSRPQLYVLDLCGTCACSSCWDDQVCIVSANFISLLAGSSTVRSPAVTTYAAGPIPEP